MQISAIFEFGGAKVASSLVAFSSYRLLFGGASAGSSCASACSVFSSCIRSVVCGDNDDALSSPRFSSIPQSKTLAEISSLEFVQFLSANLAEKKKGSRTLSQNRFCPWEPRRSAGRVGTGARVGRAPVADKVHRTRGWRLSWTRSRCTFA